MDLLSRIVNDDSPDLPLGEELLNVQVPAVESMSYPTFGRERQQSHGEGSLSGSNRANGEEGEGEKLTQERSLVERLSMPANDDEERSRSKSPSAVKKKEEEKPEVDEQRAQLQNILQSLGLSLEVEEMSKLADRTRERLYGKKHETKGPEQEIWQRSPQRPYNKSSCSSSSRSRSRSNNPSPTRRQCSHSRETRQRSECSRRSSDRRGDGLTCHGGSEDRKEEQSYVDQDEKNTQEMFSYQQNHTYSEPASLSAFSQNSFNPSSQYTADHNGTYSTASNSHWTSTQVATRLYYTRECPYPQNTHQHSAAAEVPPVIGDPYRRKCLKNNLFRNPDLLGSELQTRSFSANHCLQVISPKQPTAGSCLKEPPRPKKKRKRRKKKKNVQTNAQSEATCGQRASKKCTRKQKKSRGHRDANNIHDRQSLNTNPFMNPHLSGSKGQTGFFSRKPCVQTVGTKKPTAESRLQRAPKSQQKKNNMKVVHDAKKRRKGLQKLGEKQAKVNTLQPVEDYPEVELSEEQWPPIKQSGEQWPPTKQTEEQWPPTKQSGEQWPPTKQTEEQWPPTKQSGEQRPLTEEEIKVNLRKKLKAFNLKMKKKAPEPGCGLTSPTGEICGSS
ncbi:secernin-2 isoform 3-T3 [Spinachia spinachia]